MICSSHPSMSLSLQNVAFVVQDDVVVVDDVRDGSLVVRDRPASTSSSRTRRHRPKARDASSSSSSSRTDAAE